MAGTPKHALHPLLLCALHQRRLCTEPTESPKNESDEAENEDGGSENEGALEKEAREEGSQKADDEEEDGEEKEEEEEDDDHNEEGMVDDVLSYILRERFRYRTKYIPMGGTVNRLHREELNQCEAFLSFSAGHVWANRRVGHTWYAPLHAHLQLGPSLITLMYQVLSGQSTGETNADQAQQGPRRGAGPHSDLRQERPRRPEADIGCRDGEQQIGKEDEEESEGGSWEEGAWSGGAPQVRGRCSTG